MKMFTYIALLCTLASCKKENIPELPPPPPVDSSNIPILLWQKPILPDTGEYAAKPQFVYNNAIYYGLNWTPPTAHVQKRDVLTGDLLWKYDDFNTPPHGGFINTSAQEQVFAVKDRVIITDPNEVNGVDNHTGLRSWRTQIADTQGNSFPDCALIGDYLYSIHYNPFSPRITTSSLVRTHYLNGEQDTLLTLDYQDDYWIFLKPPTFWVKPDGDTVLLIPRHEISSKGAIFRANLYAWNLRTRTYEWQKNNFDTDGRFASGKPLVDGDRLYLNCNKALYCIDLATGTTLWERAFLDGIYYTNIVQHGNTVIVHADWEGIYAVNKDDGSIKWYNKNTPGNAEELTYFDGVVYYTSTGAGRIFAVDAETGVIKWRLASPSRAHKKTSGASFAWQGVAIDPVNRLLFAGDYYYMLCYKLPK